MAKADGLTKGDAEAGALVKEKDEPTPLKLTGKLVRVRYRVAMAGDRFVRNPGDEGEEDSAVADRLFAAGFAEPVKAGK